MTAQPIRLAYFSNAEARGGVEEHILTLLRGLDRAHFQTFLICTPRVADMLAPDLPPDVHVFPLRYSRHTQVRSAIRLMRFLRRNRIEILHSHLFHASLFAAPIGRLSGVPLIVETPHLRESWRHGWFKGSFLVDRIVGRLIDIYIAVSQANSLYLQEKKRLPARKMRVIHNGCDPDRFNPARRPTVELKLTLGFGKDDPMLLVPARLEPQKGHSVLIRALPLILKEFSSVRVVCAGDGVLRNELELQVRSLGLEPNIRFVGRQANLEDWFAVCDFTVLPSFYEGLPLVAVESLAAGRPMVATSVDGTPEVIINGKTGLTVPPGDPTLLADAVCRMLRDPGMRKSMGLAGRSWVLERFTQEKQIERTQEWYLQSLNSIRGLSPKAAEDAMVRDESVSRAAAAQRVP